MAQTAGVMNGSLWRFYIDLAAGSTHTVLGNSTQVSFNGTQAPRETTNQGSLGHASFLEGKRGATADFTCWQAEDGANNFHAIYAVIISNSLRARVTGKFTSGVAGDKAVTVTGYLTACSLSNGGPEDNCVFNGSMVMDGAPVISTNV